MPLLSQNQIPIHSFAKAVCIPIKQQPTEWTVPYAFFFSGSMRKIIAGVFNSGPRVKVNVKRNKCDFYNDFRVKRDN